MAHSFYPRFLIAAFLTVCEALAGQPTTTSVGAPVAVRVETPGGFIRIDVAGRSAIALPDDKSWVAEALERAGKPEPTTQPIDMLQGLPGKRDALSAMMLNDLSMISPSAVNRIFDSVLLPALTMQTKANPKIVFIVAPGEHIREALNKGWKAKNLRLNKVADRLELSATISIRTDGVDDETDLPALFSMSDPADRRAMLLSQYITNAERDLARVLVSRSASACLSGLSVGLVEEGLADLPKEEDQVWFVTGLSAVLAGRYTSVIHGAPVGVFIEGMIAPSRPSTVDATTIDLLHPFKTADLKPEIAEDYLDARRRKSVAVVYSWLNQAGENQIRNTINAIIRAKPADGLTLIQVIKEASGVDLARDVASR